MTNSEKPELAAAQLRAARPADSEMVDVARYLRGWIATDIFCSDRPRSQALMIRAAELLERAARPAEPPTGTLPRYIAADLFLTDGSEKMARRAHFGTRPLQPRQVLWVSLTVEEYEYLKSLARRDGVALAQWVRECINDRLAEEPTEPPFLRLRKYTSRGMRAEGAPATTDPRTETT